MRGVLYSSSACFLLKHLELQDDGEMSAGADSLVSLQLSVTSKQGRSTLIQLPVFKGKEPIGCFHSH